GASELPSKAAASAPPSAAPVPEVKPEPAQANVKVNRDSDGVRLVFSFPTATPAALFRRADTLWLIFDSGKPIDLEPIRGRGGPAIADIGVVPLEKGEAVRIRLSRPQLPSLSGEDLPDGTSWTLAFGDAVQAPSQPLLAIRN